MGLFKRSKRQPVGAACAHPELDPRWNTMADVGKPQRVDHYTCHACGVTVQADGAAERGPPGGRPDAA